MEFHENKQQSRNRKIEESGICTQKLYTYKYSLNHTFLLSTLFSSQSNTLLTK